ncbi:hypothetical protein [Streptomyces sp. NPDC018711]|uniref:hypothetical protein n=1 Tax=Streptomyces sp. NPDC018711 TaxID=3365052 RepID=UPI0037A609DA
MIAGSSSEAGTAAVTVLPEIWTDSQILAPFIFFHGSRRTRAPIAARAKESSLDDR